MDDYSEYHKRIKNFGELNRALFMAAIQGDVKEIAALLDKGAGANGTYTREGSSRQESILGAAVKDDHLEAAELLVKRGANVNMIGPDGRTALHIAARHGHAEMVAVLVKNGADRDMGFDGGTVFDLAEKAPQKSTETITALLEGYGGETLGKVFRDAARLGRLKTLEVIAQQKGFDIDNTDHHGSTALHMVAQNASGMKDPAASIRALLALGADIEAENDYGETALCKLLMERDPSPAAVSALVAGGADILRKNLTGLSNYEAAVASNNPKILPVFEEAYQKRVKAEVGKVYEGARDEMKVRPIRLKKPAPKGPK